MPDESHQMLPPGISAAVRLVGSVAVWLLARPYVVGRRIAIAVAFVSIAVGVALVALHLPWLAAAAAFAVGALGAGVLVGWARLRGPAGRTVAFIARFAFEAPPVSA